MERLTIKGERERDKKKKKKQLISFLHVYFFVWQKVGKKFLHGEQNHIFICRLLYM